MICLDTNVAIAVLKDVASPVLSRFEDALLNKTPMAVSSIVLFELQYGVMKSSQRAANAARISEFSSGPVQVLNFDAADAEEAGEIRATLKRAGTPIGPYDILIAAQARRRDALLVTANTREFRRVPGLQIEDWTTRSI
jgi:tRNA(fMet)-specific endonuclease VapC